MTRQSRLRLKCCTNEVATPFAALEEPFVDQLLVGQNDGVPRNRENGGQFPARRHAGARRQAALLDGGNNHLPDLDLKRASTMRKTAEQRIPDNGFIAAKIIGGRGCCGYSGTVFQAKQPLWLYPIHAFSV
jgi:hypothetical protein